MALELAGTVRMDGDPGVETHVQVEVDGDTLRLKSGDDLLGQWSIREIGVHALNEGFALRVEGEDLLLITEDDAALAEEMDLKAVSPRLARQVAARHKPEDREPTPEPPPEPSRFGPLAFALSGALVVVGATFLRSGDSALPRGEAEVVAGLQFWLALTIGGVLMIAAAYVLATGARWGRLAAVIILALIAAVFGLAVSDTPTDLSHLTAYGFIGGGLALGVAVVFGGLLEERS